MPVTEFEQPPSRIGGGGRRGRIGLAGWIIGLAAIVAVAVVGREPAPRDEAAVTVADPSGGPPASAPVDVSSALVVTEPDAEVKTVALRIRGRAEEPVDVVELVLVRFGLPFATQVVRPTPRGLFGGLFTLAAPRSAGTLTVVATGRDVDGADVVTVRHDIAIAALHAAFGPPPLRLGEDGIMGSRGVDLAALHPPALAGGPSAPWAWPVGRLGWQVNPAQL